MLDYRKGKRKKKKKSFWNNKISLSKHKRIKILQEKKITFLLIKNKTLEFHDKTKLFSYFAFKNYFCYYMNQAQ